MRLFLAVCYLTAVSAASAQVFPYVLKTVAGSSPTGDGGPATAALLQSPQAVAVDSTGQIYIAQGSTGGIRRVDRNGNISTFQSGFAVDMKFDSAGNLYVADGYAAVYKITPSNQVTLVAGGSYGFGGDGGPAASSRLASPLGLAIDGAGNLYIADSDNCRVRKVTTDGKIQTVAGNGICNFGFLTSANGIQATAAPLLYPDSVAVDAAGNLFIADEYDVRKVTTNGVITAIAGVGNALTDGPAVNAYIGSTATLAVDATGNLYVADQYVSLVRMITPNGQIKTVAGMLNLGAPSYGYSGDGGPGTQAHLFYPLSVAVDANNFVYIADQGNARIRKLNQSGTISTVAGASHFGGDGGPAANALLYVPIDTTFDASGNLYFSDYANHRIRKINSAGVISTVAGNGTCAYTGDGGAATAASLCFPSAIRFDPAGNLLIADGGNGVIRKVSLSGFISTFAGNGQFADKGDGGVASAASFVNLTGLAVDSVGNVYAADSGAYRVRKITPNGTISTVAGTGAAGSTGDGGLATAAKLSAMQLLAVDSADNLYIADTGNNRVRKVAAGVMSTVAGVQTCCAVTTKAASTFIGSVQGMAFDAAGNMYVTSESANAIWKVAPDNSISIAAGNGEAGFTGDGLAGGNSLYTPTGIVTDKAGNVYFADRFNNRIRELQPDSPTGLTIKSGNSQTGPEGAQLAQPLTVQMAFQAGIAVAGVPVTFAVTSGQAMLSATATNTDASGAAGVSVTLGATAGPVTIAATSAGFSVTFTETAVSTTPPPAVPTISAGGVQGAGGSSPAVTTLSPGGFATVFGTNFAPAGTARAVAASDFVNGALPTNLANTCVRTSGVNAFLSYVSPTQINFQVPAIAAGSLASLSVVTSCGTPDALSSQTVLVPTAAATPEFLYWVRNADGNNPVVAVNSVTGAYVAAPGLITGATFVPAKPGDYLTIYAISFGSTNPAGTPGVGAAGAAGLAAPATVKLGTSTLAAANVLYVGASPGTAGLYQVNIQVPAMADGDYPIAVSFGEFSTAAGAFLTVKN